jgi:predicted small integral membrane protein
MSWMAWTLPTALFIGVIFAAIALMTVLDLRYPPVTRKGFLPIATDRGDRFYIAMLGVMFINLAWWGFTDASALIGFGLSMVWLAVVMRWG